MESPHENRLNEHRLNGHGLSEQGLYGLVAKAARSSPHRAAVGTADGRLKLTYSQLDIAAGALAGRLRRLGLGPGDAVALCAGNSPEFVLTLLAVSRAGAAVAPLDPALPPDQLAARAGAAHATVAVVAAHPPVDELAAALGRAAGTNERPVWQVAMDGARAAVTVPDGSPGLPARPAGALPPDTALLLSTSGSTSAPKTVPLTAANVAASVRGIVGTYRLGPRDATLLIMPLFHGHGLIAGLLATLASGGAVWLPATGQFSASRFWPEMTAAGATWYTAVPAVHQILLKRAAGDYPRPDPPRLRFIRSCSAPLAPAVARELEVTFGAPVVPAYGMTETAHQAASNPVPAHGAVKQESVGVPTGLDLRIAGPDGGDAPDGVTGEIWLRGPAVAAGYLDNPGATAAAFPGGWVRTGDLGYQDADGYLFLTGRIKEMINRGGEKFSPQQIDAVLLSHPAVADALSFGVPDEIYGEEVSAAIIVKPGQHVSEHDLEAFCRERLGTAGAPKRIFTVAEFPMTAKHAGDRRKLAAEFAARRQAPPPRHPGQSASRR
jgi:acyl-CoA synthetase (AMP-forming)/AMP-acid ligase II